MDASLIYKQCEDYLFPTLKFSVRERVLYYHLLRLTHLEGKPSALVAILPLANAMGVAESSAREDIRSLNERGCIKIEDRSRNGHFVRVLLPEEIEGVCQRTTPLLKSTSMASTSFLVACFSRLCLRARTIVASIA